MATRSFVPQLDGYVFPLLVHRHNTTHAIHTQHIIYQPHRKLVSMPMAKLVNNFVLLCFVFLFLFNSFLKHLEWNLYDEIMYRNFFFFQCSTVELYTSFVPICSSTKFSFFFKYLNESAGSFILSKSIVIIACCCYTHTKKCPNQIANARIKNKNHHMATLVRRLFASCALSVWEREECKCFLIVYLNLKFCTYLIAC